MSGDDLVSQRANWYWFCIYSGVDWGREPWYSTLRDRRLDPYPDWCYTHHAPDGFLEETGLIRGPSGNPLGGFAAEKAYQKAAQERAAAEQDDMLRKMILSYGAPTRPAGHEQATVARINAQHQYSSSGSSSTGNSNSQSADVNQSSSARSTQPQTENAQRTGGSDLSSKPATGSSNWSAWTWSEAHQKYYSARYKSDGDVEYAWATQTHMSYFDQATGVNVGSYID